MRRYYTLWCINFCLSTGAMSTAIFVVGLTMINMKKYFFYNRSAHFGSSVLGLKPKRACNCECGTKE